MGLDIYAGPVTRYVAGDWLTVVQQAGLAQGFSVRMFRGGVEDDGDGAPDLDTAAEVVEQWQRALLQALGLEDGWVDRAEADYETDKPDWDGYGAVVLLAAYEEQPDLVPGSATRRGLRRSTVKAVVPREFPDAPAFKAATKAPARFPTLIGGAEWCLPLAGGPDLFAGTAPGGNEVVMGRVDTLHRELVELNRATLQLSPAQLAEAREEGPPEAGAPVEAVAPFGLAVLLAMAEYAVAHRVAWIMDY